MTTNYLATTAEERAFRAELRKRNISKIRRGVAPSPPTDIRLTFDRFVRTIEQLVAEHPGAVVLSVDNPEYLLVGYLVHTPDESFVRSIHTPLDVVKGKGFETPQRRSIRAAQFQSAAFPEADR